MNSENIRSMTTCRQLEEFEDTRGVIRICISKKNRQHNGQKKKYERTTNDLQNLEYMVTIRITTI
jgi:hypothetical protein